MFAFSVFGPQPVPLDQIRDGDFALFRSRVKRLGLSYVVNLALDVVILVYVGEYLPPEATSALFQAEFDWFQLWISLQFLCFLIGFLVCFFAYTWPMQILNKQYWEVANACFQSLMMSQMAVFFSVLFVDIMKGLYGAMGIKFKGGEPTLAEIAFNLLVRVAQVLSLQFLVVMASWVVRERQNQLDLERKARRLADAIDRQKKVTWSELMQATDQTPADCSECSICL